MLQFSYLSNGVSCFTTSDKNCEWKQSCVKLEFIILEALDGREMLIKGIVLSTSFSFVCGALNRAVHLCYTIHFHTSLPLISAEPLCVDYWCDMIRVSWCLAQLAFVSWLKYLCGVLSAGNFSSSLSPLGLKLHFVCFEWLFSQAPSQVVVVPVPGPSRSMVLLVWSHSERVILCERSKCINSQCCRHSIELLFVFWIWL